MSTKFVLFQARHEHETIKWIPAVFENWEGQWGEFKITKEFKKSLANRDYIDLYVTGLTPGFESIVLFLKKNKIGVSTYHFDSVEKEYKIIDYIDYYSQC